MDPEYAGPRCEHQLNRISGFRQEFISRTNPVTLHADLEMRFGIALPHKAKINTAVKISESTDALKLELETVSAFVFSQPMTEESLVAMSTNLAKTAYSYAVYVVATLTREFGLSAPLLLGPFSDGVFHPTPPESPEPAAKENEHGEGNESARAPS